MKWDLETSTPLLPVNVCLLAATFAPPIPDHGDCPLEGVTPVHKGVTKATSMSSDTFPQDPPTATSL